MTLLLFMALQLQVVTGTVLHTYDEVYVSPDGGHDGIEDAPLRIQRRAGDDSVDAGELTLVLKSRLFLGASEPVGIPAPPTGGHRARLLLDGAEVYSGVVGLEDLGCDEVDDDRLWEITLRDDAADALQARLGEVFCDAQEVRDRVTPVQLRSMDDAGQQNARRDWYDLADLWAAVLAECDALYVGPEVGGYRQYEIDVAGETEYRFTHHRVATRSTGIDQAPQWTGAELSERIGELMGWRLLPRYAAWPGRTIEVDAVLGHWDDQADGQGLRVIPDQPAGYPSHSAAPPEVSQLGVQTRERGQSIAWYASETLILDEAGVSQNGGDGSAVIDLDWSVVGVTFNAEYTRRIPRADGGDDVEELVTGIAVADILPTETQFVEYVDATEWPGYEATRDDLAVVLSLAHSVEVGGQTYRPTLYPAGAGTVATWALWVWRAQRRLAAPRAEVEMAVDCRAPADGGVGLPELLERVVWRGRVWEVVEVDTDAEHPIDTRLVLARPGRLVPNWYPEAS